MIIINYYYFVLIITINHYYYYYVGRYETSDKLMSLVKHAESDAWLSLGLCFYLNVLPLTRQLSNLSGSLWSKALQGQRAQRIEMLLLHEFHEQKFMLPDKLSNKVSCRPTASGFVQTNPARQPTNNKHCIAYLSMTPALLPGHCALQLSCRANPSEGQVS